MWFFLPGVQGVVHGYGISSLAVPPALIGKETMQTVDRFWSVRHYPDGNCIEVVSLAQEATTMGAARLMLCRMRFSVTTRGTMATPSVSHFGQPTSRQPA